MTVTTQTHWNQRNKLIFFILLHTLKKICTYFYIINQWINRITTLFIHLLLFLLLLFLRSSSSRSAKTCSLISRILLLNGNLLKAFWQTPRTSFRFLNDFSWSIRYLIFWAKCARELIIR